MKIVNYQKKYHEEIIKIIKSLNPGWFDDNAVTNIPKDIQVQRCFLALDCEELVGFISIYSHEAIGYIGWMGVDPKMRRKGIGKYLIQYIEKYFRDIGILEIRVETIVYQSPVDGTYDETIKFYSAMNFKIFSEEELDEDNGFKFKKGILTKNLLTS